MAKMPKPEEMIASRASFPEKSWMDVKTEIKAGMYAYPAKVDIMEGLHMPHSGPEPSATPPSPRRWPVWGLPTLTPGLPKRKTGTCPKTGKKSSIRP